MPAHEHKPRAGTTGRRLLAIEVKATASPRVGDARHIQWLRSTAPERSSAGAVLHTGPDVITLDDDIFAVPIGAMTTIIGAIATATNLFG